MDAIVGLREGMHWDLLVRIVCGASDATLDR